MDLEGDFQPQRSCGGVTVKKSGKEVRRDNGSRRSMPALLGRWRSLVTKPIQKAGPGPGARVRVAGTPPPPV